MKQAIGGKVFWRVSWLKYGGKLIDPDALANQNEQVHLLLMPHYFRLLREGEEVAKGWSSDWVFDPLDDKEVQLVTKADMIEYLNPKGEWEEI